MATVLTYRIVSLVLKTCVFLSNGHVSATWSMATFPAYFTVYIVSLVMVVVNTVICYDSAGQVTATRPVAHSDISYIVSLVVVVNFLIAIILVAK